MANGLDKERSREGRLRVREILLREWDVLGISDFPEAHRQYDAYAAKVYVMLMDERSGEDAIAAYLYQTATDRIGCSPGQSLAQICATAAAAVVALRPELDFH